MTAEETPAPSQTGRGSTSAAKAYDRRSRRAAAVGAGRLTRTGSPVAAALSRVPFVATIILLLAGGIVGVLWLNTMSDAAGLQASASRIRQADLKNQIQALQRDINTGQDPARLAAEAQQLGMVPLDDAALLQVGADGRGTVIGTPTPVAGPAAPLPTTASTPANTPLTTAAATTTRSATSPATTSPATTSPATTSPAKTAPATTSPAKTTTTPAKTTTTPAKATTTPAKTTPGQSTPVKTTPVKTTPVKTTPVKTTPGRTTPATAQQLTTTGAGR